MLPLLVLLTLAATDEIAAGRVVRVSGRDTLPVPGALVILHRVSPDAQGAIDSVRADAAGRFEFRFTADSVGSYLVSARWLAIEYFAPPLLAGGNDRAIRLLVADTSSVTPVAVTARHVVVSGPAPDGTRTVVDLLVLANTGVMTRVGRDSAAPSWRFLLPPFAANLRVADSDFAATAFDQHGDTLLLFAPIPPGERQLFLDYQVTPGTRRLLIPIDAPLAAVNILAEEVLRIRDATEQSDTTVNGRRFHRWTRSFQRAGALELSLPGSSTAPWTLPALIGVVGSMLVVVTVVALRRRGDRTTAPAFASTPAHADALLAAVVALDARFHGGPNGSTPAAWADYVAERARLKSELDRVLPP